MVSNDSIPLITTETLQYRLDTNNSGKSGGQRSSLTRCAQKFGTFRAELSSATPDAEVIEDSKNDLVREVELFDLELTKLILWQHNLVRQTKRNQIAEAEREREIEVLKQQVRESRVLAHASVERKNCLSEYESLARVINDNHPTSSSELRKQTVEIRSEISGLEEARAKKDEILGVREAQYQLLMQYMADLKQSLREDGNDDGKTTGHDEDNKPQPMECDNLYADL